MKKPSSKSIAPTAWPAFPELLTALGLGACSFSPAPIIQYRADSADAIWDHGTEYHSRRTGALDIRTGFLEYSSEDVLGYEGPHPLFFHVAAENRSNSAVLISPGDFRIEIPCADSVLVAIDPEAVIHRARTEQASEDARYAGDLGTNLAVGLLEVVLEVASSFATKTKEQKRDWEESEEQTRQRREDEERRHRERTEALTTRRVFWSDSALRKTTVPPGGSVRGRVAFAVKAHSKPSDSLLLQYREKDGRHVDLITYGLVQEKPPAASLATSAPDSTPKTTGSRSAPSQRRHTSGHSALYGL